MKKTGLGYILHREITVMKTTMLEHDRSNINQLTRNHNKSKNQNKSKTQSVHHQNHHANPHSTNGHNQSTVNHHSNTQGVFFFVVVVFFNCEAMLFFLFLHESIICCWYSLEVPQSMKTYIVGTH